MPRNNATEAPSLSVVVPHLNEPDDLSHCLAALTAQRGHGIDFEIIVVDNGSREPPSAVCAAYPGVQLEIERIPGPGPARNRGAAAATAPLLAFLDADCVPQPGWARAISDFMDTHPTVDFAGGDIGLLPRDAGRMTAIEAYESVYSYRARLYVERHGFAATGNMVVRASVFRAVGPFGGIASMEDTEWGQRATSAGYRIGYINDARVCTPSCTSFPELARRWDRHVAHEFRQLEGRPMRIAAWAARSLLVAASPVAEVAPIVKSERLVNARDRLMALMCLSRVRLYRAWRMLTIAFGRDAKKITEGWNRN